MLPLGSFVSRQTVAHCSLEEMYLNFITCCWPDCCTYIVSHFEFSLLLTLVQKSSGTLFVSLYTLWKLEFFLELSQRSCNEKSINSCILFCLKVKLFICSAVNACSEREDDDVHRKCGQCQSSSWVGLSCTFDVVQKMPVLSIIESYAFIPLLFFTTVHFPRFFKESCLRNHS